jgi:hypothetical protein
MTCIERIPARFAAKAILVAAIGITGIQAAAAAGNSEKSFSIHGQVSTICHAELIDPNPLASGDQVDIGQISELCNNADGYVVTLTYSPDLGGKTLIIDQKNITLSPTGETVVFESSNPDIRNHHVSLVVNDTDFSKYNLGVHISPRGQVF